MQNTTRRHRGKVHNIKFHSESAKVVHFIDYIIGRINYEFEASHPLEHVRKETGENYSRFNT